MSDAQTFYFLLAAFYLFECLSFAPAGARAFVSRGRRASRWHKRGYAFRFSGADKDVFCAPLIPWPGMLAVFPKPEPIIEKYSPQALRHLRKRSISLERLTRTLRRFSLVIFLHYFVILPYFYVYHLGGVWVLILIVLGEFLAFVTAFQFYFIHRRLFPDAKGERRLGTFYNAFFPWHAMRASDLIVRRVSKNWDPLLLLASAPHARNNLGDLCHLWRKGRYEGETRELELLLNEAEIKTTGWTIPPRRDAGQSYCPLCHTVYEAGPDECADCRGVRLSS